MFANTYEVDEYVRQFGADPVLGPAARTLANLRDAADANSDGWAYWRKPSAAAKRLQEILYYAHRNRVIHGRPYAASAAEVRAALRPVKSFRTRTGIDFEIEEPG